MSRNLVDEWTEPGFEICLSCPLARCVESSPFCPRQQMLAVQQQETHEDWLTTKQVAARMQVNLHTVNDWVRAGRILSVAEVRDGRRKRLYAPSEIDRWEALWVRPKGAAIAQDIGGLE